MSDTLVEWGGERWKILSTGAWKDGTVYCHLASTTRFIKPAGLFSRRKQRNELMPVQIADWLPDGMVESAMYRPIGFFRWNRSLQGAYRRGEEDCRAGVALDDCPYADTRTRRGAVSWSRAYRSAWADGWRHEYNPGGFQ